MSRVRIPAGAQARSESKDSDLFVFVERVRPSQITPNSPLEACPAQVILAIRPYLRFKGLIQAATNIYLRFRGLVAKYKHHANRMISMSRCPIYSVHNVLATP